ncbi:TPA: hypothetical protein U0G56_002278 [Listeria monocytogenes]|nr:hypothetical protein [Listeria monocytogenes]HAC3885368.1 hypothetical protein [Listeria monocytogenes]HDT8851201.1 hypothetical protein [Listeria monocytogenes]HEL6930759.1 hypothetical protein [Listeria monocytogenes]HEL8989835.1 hypothetical protein [Listeria monocytogenes]
MSIDMYVSKSKAQATSTSQVCQQHLEGYEALQQAISQFTLEPFLKGKAYDSAKAYYSTVLYPLVQGGILLTEATEEAVKKFPERYQSEVDSGDLKQSELEEQIRRVNELIYQANDLENQVRQSPLSETDQQIQLQFNQALLEAYQTSKQELEEKLQKLIAFHASSPRIFSEIASLKQAIDQGLAQTKTAWNSTSGTFMIPSQEKLAWANTIRAFQQKKEAQEEPDTTGRTYTRIDLGNGTYIWAWSKDGRTLTQDDIQFTVKHDKWAGKDGGLGEMLTQAEAMKAEAKDFDPVKAIKEIADLLTPLGDGIRVVTGQDPITGEKLSGSERGLSALFIIPLAKIGKYGGKGFKFVTEGVEDLNKLHKKVDKVKEVEKSTKKAIKDIPKLKWESKGFSKIGKNYKPSQFIEQLEEEGWVKTVEQGGSKSGPATILTNPNTGEKIRIHTSPSNGKPYFRVQNKGGNYIDDTGNFPSNATKQEVRDLTHFYFN